MKHIRALPPVSTGVLGSTFRATPSPRSRPLQVPLILAEVGGEGEHFFLQLSSMPSAPSPNNVEPKISKVLVSCRLGVVSSRLG